MILIFDKDGKYFNESRTVKDAAEIANTLPGNVSQIINGFYGNISANGFYFVRYDLKESETKKQDYIDKLENIFEIIIVCSKQNTLQDKIDKLIKLL